MAQVLLIEADRLLAQNLAGRLKRAGHSVKWLIDPQTAISQADKQTPEVVIMDLLLANRSGAEFLYEFRSYPEWQDVPVVVYSNMDSEEAKGYGPVFSQLGVARYFYKPATKLSQLVEAVEALGQPAPA